MSTSALSRSEARLTPEIKVGDLIRIDPPGQVGSNYVVRAIVPNEIYISSPGYPDDISKLVPSTGEASMESLEGWVVSGLEEAGYTATRLQTDLEKEYQRFMLTSALLNHLTTGTSSKVAYEMRNVVDRWLLSLYNEYEFPFELLPVPTDDQIKAHFLKELA